ncbi:MAG: hypothetical protein ACXWLM_02710, partial [Myxococcales bacterium]
MDYLPDALQFLAALLAAGFVAALALAGYEFYLKLYQRYLAQLGQTSALVVAGAEAQQPSSLG